MTVNVDRDMTCPPCPFCESKNTNEFLISKVIDGKRRERLITRCLDCFSEASTEMWRTLSDEFAKLRQAEESLDWIIKWEYIKGSVFVRVDMPPYLKSRLGGIG